MLDEVWRLRRLHDLLSLNQWTVQIEWIDKIEAVVGASHAVADLDQQLLAIVCAGASVDIQNLDARLPHLQRFADLKLRQGPRRAVVRLEQQLVELAAKIGPHDTFPLSSREDDLDRLAHAELVSSHRQWRGARGVRARDREMPTGAQHGYQRDARRAGHACPLSSRIDVDQRAADVHLPGSRRVDARLRLDLDLGGRGNLDPDRGDLDLAGLGGDLDVALRFDRDLVVSAGDYDLVAAALVDDLDPLGTAAVAEANDMSAARLDGAVVVLPVAVVLGRFVLAVPQRADDVGMFEAAVFECHKHLVVDFRQEIAAAIIAGHRGDDACPVAFMLEIEPREMHLHPVHAVGVSIVGNDADNDAVEPAIAVARGEQGPQQFVVDHVAFLRAEKYVLYPFLGRKECSTQST